MPLKSEATRVALTNPKNEFLFKFPRNFGSNLEQATNLAPRADAKAVFAVAALQTGWVGSNDA